jgi:hypothetical protein
MMASVSISSPNFHALPAKNLNSESVDYILMRMRYIKVMHEKFRRRDGGKYCLKIIKQQQHLFLPSWEMVINR